MICASTARVLPAPARLKVGYASELVQCIFIPVCPR